MNIHLSFDPNAFLKNLEIKVIHSKTFPFSFHILQKYRLSIYELDNRWIFNYLLNSSHFLIEYLYIDKKRLISESEHDPANSPFISISKITY